MRMTSVTRVARLAVLALALFPMAARAADVKIGYIDSAKIFQDYRLAQDAQASFDRQVQGWRSEAAEKQKAVDQLRVEVRDQGPILSALRRQEREEALQRAISDYEKFVQDIWGPQGKAAQENERATQEIVTQIRTSVERIAGDRQLDLVIDAASGFIIYADKSLDLTAVVLSDLTARTVGGASH
jgi:outer membrane protein